VRRVLDGSLDERGDKSYEIRVMTSNLPKGF
jgi:hypothetical protein